MSGNESIGKETLVVELTPAGRGAVAVVLVAGPQATQAVNQCFRPNRMQNVEEAPVEKILFGRWSSASGEELIVCQRSPARIEIHCHGGVAAVGAVIESLVAGGCRHVSWQDWLRIAGVDPIQADAQMALASAPTERTAAILLDQYQGALGTAIREIADAASAANWSLAIEKIGAVLTFRNVGTHLTVPWRVVLAGRTNVGKSSLINTLAGFERAIVSHQPGTTRDVVTTETAMDGWPVQLIDTAGLRTTDDELEAAGVGLALETIRTADLILAVDDVREASTPLAGAHDELGPTFAELQRTRPVISVRNKVDLTPPAARIASRYDTNRGRATILTSAITGEGIADLIRAIVRELVPVMPAPGSAVAFTTDQLAAFGLARSAVERCDSSGVRNALQPLLPQSASSK